MRLKERVAIVTGAASGIGCGTAQAMAGEGAATVLVDVADEVFKVAGDITRAGHRAIAVKADISNDAEIGQAVEKTAREFGRIDILVNNATCAIPASAGKKLFHETSKEDWKVEIDTTLIGTLICCRAVIPYMIQNNRGRIINIASVAAKTGQPTVSIYCAAKAGIAGASRAIARELGRYNITVNCVSPGCIRTPRTASIVMNNPEMEKLWISGIPLGRIGEPEDIASMIVFLASDEAGYITGQDYNVDGGHVME
jgi:NAD(P)-dependent dehydrogenase (short-subunit alcohol dehydrogenase family)